MFAVRPNS